MPRIGIGFGRIAQGAGDALEPVAAKSVDRLLAGPLPEEVAQSIVRHHVLERVVSEIVASDEFRAAFTAALRDERTGELVDEVAESPLIERLVRDAVTSPAVRSALTKQTTSIGTEMVGSLRSTAARADAAVERPPRRWLRRQPRDGERLEGSYAGLVSRGSALVLDVLIAQLIYLVGAATVGLVLSLTVGVERGWAYGILAAAGWLIVQAVYFVGFWSAAGRTPGMALLGLRLRNDRNTRPGVIRSCIRLIGLWLAIAFVLIGFVPVLVDDRRRALQDFLAGTEVVYSSGVGDVGSPA